MERPTRREFLRNSFAAACATGITSSLSAAGLTAATVHVPTAVASPLPAEPLPIKKGILLDMLPSKLSYPDRFKMARDVGFEVIQAPTTPDEHEAEEIKRAADGANVRIDSVMNIDHWKYPLSSGDPAVVNPQTSYREAWSRSQKEIRKLLPLAEELKIVIAIEEVWNKFLLSPLEMAAYIKEFQSPWM